jgi:methyl-accepting chemotaxis protein
MKKRSLSLRVELLLPIAIILVVVLLPASWFFAKARTAAMTESFTEHLQGLAYTSGYMLHSAAEEYAKKNGFVYHRKTESELKSDTEMDRVIHDAWSTFHADAHLESITKEVDKEGTTHVVALSPGRIRDECRSCHNPSGLDIFEGKKDGELVAVFGVSGSTASIHEAATRIQFLVALLGVVAFVLLGGTIAFVSGRVVFQPIKSMIGACDAIAQGDLTTTVPVVRDDEIGVLGNRFNIMISSTRKALGEVAESMASVASVVAQLSSRVEEMSAGVEEQTSQSKQVVTAMEEMMKTVSENSATAKGTVKVVQDAQASANEGGQSVQKTVAAVRNIGQSVQNFATTISSLDASSRDIGTIISTISDIADQTNLLALNAAIEAARAGEEGRGFAVVADEVRKLAERTMKATKEIKSMITDIQTSSHSATASLDEGTSAVAKGIALAEAAGATLDDIVKVTNAVVNSVNQMAMASDAQAATGAEVSGNVSTISEVTDAHANAIRELAQATGDLSGASQRVQELLSRFVLQEEHRPGQNTKKRSAARYHAQKEEMVSV